MAVGCTNSPALTSHIEPMVCALAGSCIPLHLCPAFPSLHRKGLAGLAGEWDLVCVWWVVKENDKNVAGI